MSYLRRQLIRLAHAKPTLRKDLLPLLKEASSDVEIYDYRTEKFIRPATPEEYADYLSDVGDDPVGAVSGRPYGIRGSIYMEEATRKRRLANFGRGEIAQYKGREYRVEFSGKTRYGHRTKLQFMDGSKSFWVDTSKVAPPTAPSDFGNSGRRRGRGSTKPGSITPRQLDYISRNRWDWFDTFDESYPGDKAIAKLSASVASEIISEMRSGY